ncbi:hypothetical protein [Pedosphaera parvula]|uniref:RanBP2-type domain-containing protein n=1 Tax=Pedosphaera parvula (strain Ellin514) TaxID=320771 RepID=B9XM98_PEDPL|nr:hypothetical protein [Pedosphaera parvula]EEF59091.1 hypothetical protein Cflav_PD2219 [Pedosphaera parvula Ellin514]
MDKVVMNDGQEIGEVKTNAKVNALQWGMVVVTFLFGIVLAFGAVAVMATSGSPDIFAGLFRIGLAIYFFYVAKRAWGELSAANLLSKQTVWMVALTSTLAVFGILWQGIIYGATRSGRLTWGGLILPLLPVAIMAHWIQRKLYPSEPLGRVGKGPDWTCQPCGEVHESQFDSCWKCGKGKVREGQH